MNLTEQRGDWRPAARFLIICCLLVPVLAACAINPHHVRRGAFTSREYGVAVSPRVTRSANPPHGGGHYLVGSPYKVHGEWYTPKADPTGYTVTGTASWYGYDFHGRLTANGEIFNANAISGGSPDLPLPSYARVTNLDNGRSLLVRFNDRGPYMAGRVVDLSEKAATLLGYVNDGTARVKVQYVGPAPLNGDDTRFLMASLNQSTSGERPTTRLAMAEPAQIRPLIAPQPRPVPLFAPHTPHTRTAGSPQLNEVLSSVSSLFSYAEAKSANVEVNSAHAAVDAMAARVPDLADWVATTDDDHRAVQLDLGSYENAGTAESVAEQFAMLGAVDEGQVTDDSGHAATQLTLTHLKPGVATSDVRDLARRLGLKVVGPN